MEAYISARGRCRAFFSNLLGAGARGAGRRGGRGDAVAVAVAPAKRRTATVNSPPGSTSSVPALPLIQA